uniref:Uncharacterized protein n=1 Tax=Cacopsylla melanoneura TaxID=428564 RepID=A0A8D9C332_9HEMI
MKLKFETFLIKHVKDHQVQLQNLMKIKNFGAMYVQQNFNMRNIWFCMFQESMLEIRSMLKMKTHLAWTKIFLIQLQLKKNLMKVVPLHVFLIILPIYKVVV